MRPGIGSEHRRLRVRPEVFDLTLQARRLAPVVGILAGDPLSARQRQAAIERRRQSPVRLGYDPDPRVTLSPPAQPASNRRIAAPVVNNQELEIGERLVQDRVQRLVEHLERRIVHRHQHRNRRRYHLAPQRTAHWAKVNSVHNRCPRACVCSSGSSSGHGNRSRTSSRKGPASQASTGAPKPCLGRAEISVGQFPGIRFPQQNLLLPAADQIVAPGAAASIPESGDRGTDFSPRSHTLPVRCPSCG